MRVKTYKNYYRLFDDLRGELIKIQCVKLIQNKLKFVLKNTSYEIDMRNIDPKQREYFTTKQSRLKFNDDMNRFMKITTPGFKG